MKRGSITVFLALLLTVCITLSMVALEAARIHGLQTRLEEATASALDSVFAGYDSELLKEFDLFLLNTKEVSLADELQWYAAQELSPTLWQLLPSGNLFRQSVQEVEIWDITYADGRGGEVLIQNVLDYMKYRTVGIGLEAFMSQLKLLEDGEDAQQSLEQEQEASEQTSQKSLTEDISDEDREKYEEIMEESWLEKINKIRKDGWLEFVLPIDSAVSDTSISGKSLPSSRYTLASLFYRMSFGSISDQLLFSEYLLEHCTCFTTATASADLVCELEYILKGKKSDRENLKSTVQSLFLLRESMNLLALARSPSLTAQADTLAALMVGWTGLAPVIKLVQLAICAGWSVAETIVDLRTLLSGGNVPLLKDSSSWNLALEQVTDLVNGNRLLVGKQQDGLSYKDYLRLMLYTVGLQKKAYRTMDVIQLRMQRERADFDLLQCAYAVEVNVSATAAPLFYAVRQKYQLSTAQSRMY